MKTLKIFFIASALLLSFIIKSYAQTTQAEYNYITKGYKVELEGGLDPKKGYYFKDLNEAEITQGTTIRNCSFKALFREGEKKPCAILCIYKRIDNNYVDFLCIPSLSSAKDIWNQAFQKYSTYTDNSGGSLALIWGMAKLSSLLTE